MSDYHEAGSLIRDIDTRDLDVDQRVALAQVKALLSVSQELSDLPERLGERLR